MTAPLGNGARWNVVYTAPNSKRKLDGFLEVHHMNRTVVRTIALYDNRSPSLLVKRYLKNGEDFPGDGTLTIDAYSVELVQEELGFSSTSSIAPQLPPSRSVAARIPASKAPPWSAFPRISSSVAATRLPDQALIARVGTEWNVQYTKIPMRKVKKTLEGVLRLDQKTPLQQKVVLLDNEGYEIGAKFLAGSEEIKIGMTIDFERFVVIDVIDLKSDSSALAEVVVIQDSPVILKKLPRLDPKSSSQGKVTNRASPLENVELEIGELIENSGTRRIRAPSKTCRKQEIQPKRRDSVQVISCCKRPGNESSRESSGAANSCSRDPVSLGRGGSSMHPSTSGRRYEEKRSATLDCVGRIEKLNVGRACPESFDDDCFCIEHDMKQQKNRLHNTRPGFVINLDDHFDVVMEQCKLSAEEFESEASLPTRSGFSKCSEEVENVLDKKHFRVRDFWEGYKLYCFGYYSHCSRSKEQFLASKMGRAVCLLHTEMDVRWGSKFDETVRQVWAMMEEYVKVRHGQDCTNLRALMEEFEDVKELSSSENGSLLLQLIKDDEHGTEGLHKHSRDIQIQSTNIFDQLRSRLNQVDSNLGNLKKSSGTSSTSGILSDVDNCELGLKNSCENGSVGNAANFSIGSRNRPKEWRKSAQTSFDLEF